MPTKKTFCISTHDALWKKLHSSLPSIEGRDALLFAMLQGDRAEADKLVSVYGAERLALWSRQAMETLIRLYLAGQLPFCQLTAAAQASLAQPVEERAVCVGSPEGDPGSVSKGFTLMLLRALGVAAMDLGKNVPAERFLQMVRENHVSFVVCTLFTGAGLVTVGTIDRQARQEGIRKSFELLAAGTAIPREALRLCGADALETDAAFVAERVAQWLKK